MPEDIEKFEKNLIAHLKSREFSANQARSYSATITKFKTSGFIIDRIWKYGQPPRIDGFVVGGKFGTNEIGKFGDIVKNPEFRRCEIFPIGIINPDGWGFRARFGEGADQFQGR